MVELLYASKKIVLGGGGVVTEDVRSKLDL